MRSRQILSGLAGAALLTLASGQASALSKRIEVVQQGDFILIGNTLAQNCSAATPPPKAGMTMCPLMGVADTAPDVFWRAENGTATANTSIMMDQAQTAAVLTLPEGATVTHAYLHWSASLIGSPDSKASIQCVGSPSVEVDADKSLQVPGAYHASGDVTNYVKTNGSCTYMISGVTSSEFKGANEGEGFSVWWMVVLYSHPKEPHRQLTLYDGIDPIGNGATSISLVSDLLVPNNFTKFSVAKVGVVGYDGDTGLGGDQFIFFDPMSMMETPLADNGGNPEEFFNSSHSYLGKAVSTPGDLPQLSGSLLSMSHLDMDVIDITTHISAGDTQFGFKAVGSDPVYVGGVMTSIPTFTDADKDGISDDEETSEGTDPNDADTDNDGVLDGQEGCSTAENCTNPMWNADSDGDGLINALDPDSDDDGLYDGTELGLDCSNPATDNSLGHCIADADTGKTTTDPMDADSDDGGVSDGSEDADLNGAIDIGETDPTNGHPDDDLINVDSDGDGLSEPLEQHIGSDPQDADSDDDGVLDSDEANFADDTDGDGLPNVLDVDSDNDALFDGTELGSQCDDPSTDAPKIHCRADADPGTGTSMVDADTDNGGVNDGSEDTNLDGKLDAGELDPTEGHGIDDGTVKDSDGDGLSDDLEDILGSDKTDTDSDDDGVPDAEEANPSNDEDDDGLFNVLDEDSDEDGLFDGTESGYGCGPDTDKTKGHCIPDADQGKTTTSMVDPDTDNGGVPDGAEDFDKDGKYESNAGEGNPLDPSDDVNIILCIEDHPSCGPENNGKVCDPMTTLCVDGCRDVDGSRCPDGKICIFPDPAVEVGYCGNDPSPGPTPPGEVIIYDGCICGVPSGAGGRDFGWALAASAALAACWRRRARRFE